MTEPFTTPATPTPQSVIPPDEAKRLEALRRYNILDTPPEAAFDRITSLAAQVFDVPIALVSLIDESRGWFKSSYGFKLQEVQRDDTICSLALLSNQILVIPDTRQDDRLVCNPFVQSEPGLRFYAGAPLITHDGFNLGTLCLLDTKPREPLTEKQETMLLDLAATVMDELELHLAVRKVAQIDAALLEVTQGVSAVVGDAFFSALVQHLAKTLGFDYAYIGLVSGKQQETIRTIAACAKEQLIDNFEYLLEGTPCWEVLQQRKLCCHSHSVQTLFPDAPLLEPLGIESYIAVPFFDAAGVPLGLLSVMDGKPIANVQLAESLLTIFSLRITSELERQQIETVRQETQQDLEHLVEQRTIELSQTNEQLQREITERQQAQLALEKEREVLRVLLDTVQAGIVACNAEGVLTLFNQAAREFHGLPEEPLPPDQWAVRYNLYRPDGKTLLPRNEIPLFRAVQGETIHNAEMVIAPKGGTARTLLASGQVIIDRQGKKQGAVVVMHDITDRKQQEAERAQLLRQQVQEQTARLEAEADQRKAAFLSEVSTVLASSLDYQQTLPQVANLITPFFADWCAIDLLQDNSVQRVAVAHRDPAKVKLGWQIHQQFPTQMDVPHGVAKVLRTGKLEMAAEIPDAALAAAAQNAEHLQILRELGLKSCIIMPLIARGQILGAVSFITAESDRRYQEADLVLAEDIAHRVAIAIDNANLYEAERTARSTAEAANRVKDEFLAILSHELRTPLNPIMGWTKLLRSGKLDAAKTAHALETIERNAQLQIQLIEDLLDVSRILQGKLSLKIAAVDLESMIQSALETVRLTAEEKSIQLDTKFDLAIGEVLGDAIRLQQVVWNLLTNAIKFTPRGGRVEVKLLFIADGSLSLKDKSQTTDEEQIGYAQIEVQDTGKGISPDFLPHVFEYFRQADSSTTRNFNGLGLGLAIVRNLVELHGGTISINSPGEDQGTTSTVRLPLRSRASSKTKPETHLPPLALDSQPLQGVQILVVDDEPDSRALAVSILEEAGAIPTAAGDAIEALAILAHSKPDVLVSDIGMPNMDGYTLLKKIRQMLPAQMIPAIAITAYAAEIDQQQAIRAGFQQYMTKPIEPEEFVRAIRTLCNSKEPAALVNRRQEQP
ncbi:GAF domain-containing protein [Leptolyngbya sp. FACHB-711]|uniref:GAF domain-containing protein n=1 Tax=unclassified Leptolyngbya TaxID=2650499 RepID=UPI001684288F|nr:GAF domain-containing protein [Leptolyngbya sp. FACHB-711]MBD2028043.1 GAF domain-containing protein [Leptolyngbya sp. FACHB-711]